MRHLCLIIETNLRADAENVLKLVFIFRLCNRKLILFTVTNPIDVIKIRMQLDNELSAKKGGVMSAMGSRYYRGFLRGCVRIVSEEGIRGLYKG